MNDLPAHGPIPEGGPKVSPAATVLIFRRCQAGGPPELLMVQRAKEMRFFGGAAVFPGGRVDPEDRALALLLAPQDEQELASAKVAAIRETLEETGLLIALRETVSAAQAAEARAMLMEQGNLASVLDRFDWHLDLGRLIWFAHWCPPIDRAFDTRFFVTDLGTGAVDVAVDATENTRLFWASAKQAIALAEAGEVRIIFPTLRNLDRVALFDDFAQVCAHIAQFPPHRITPQVQERDGEKWLVIPDGHGYPILEQRFSAALRS